MRLLRDILLIALLLVLGACASAGEPQPSLYDVELIVTLNGNSQPGRLPNYVNKYGSFRGAMQVAAAYADKYGKAICLDNPFGQAVPMSSARWHRWSPSEMQEFADVCRETTERGYLLIIYVGGPLGLPPRPDESAYQWRERYLATLQPVLDCEPLLLGIDHGGYHGADYASDKHEWMSWHSEIVHGPDGGWAQVVQELLDDGQRLYIESETAIDSPACFHRCGGWLLWQRYQLLKDRGWSNSKRRVIPPHMLAGPTIIGLKKVFREIDVPAKWELVEEVRRLGHIPNVNLSQLEGMSK